MRIRVFTVAGLFVIATIVAHVVRAAEPIPASVQAVLDEVTSRPVYANGTWGYRFVDLQTGEVLLERNPSKLFVTGSILKLYATGTALATLGPDFRFRTPVYKRGNVAGGNLVGDLVLVASGDTSFGLRERPDGTLAYNNFPEVDHNYADTGFAGAALLANSDPLAGLDDLARQVRDHGIRQIMGDVLIDDRLYKTYRDWPDGILSPIWVNENVIDITTVSTAVGSNAHVDWRPRSAAIRVIAQVKTVSGTGTPLVVDSPEPGVVRIRGEISAGSPPIVNIWQIADPAGFARIAFIEALERAGVRVNAKRTNALPEFDSYPASDKVAERVSLPLAEYVKVINKVSYNRGADAVLCMIAVAKGSRDCAEGLRTELATIVGLGVSPNGTLLFDGAGSSEYDRSTPADFTTFLRSITAEAWGPSLRRALPILGVDGTAATNQTGTPAAGHVFPKSGTRLQATPTDEQVILSALTQAGYIDAASGRKIAFALFLRDISISGDLHEFFDADHDQGRIVGAIQQAY